MYGIRVIKVPEMKILVLGCGNIGSVVAEDIAQNLSSAQITIADMNEDRVKGVVSRIGRDNVSWSKVDALNHDDLVNTLRKFDLAVGALPGVIGYRVCEAAISAGKDIVDVSYMPEDVMTLHQDALKAEISVLPDCGMSPGLGSILVGHAASKLDRVECVHMMNGGLPETPVPPLGYVITWSVNDLIDMYCRKVTIVKKGKTVEVEPMSGLEEIRFSGVGKLEAFYTDGLRTMLYAMKGVKDMWEKTLRYPGHVEKIKLLKTLGFFDAEPLNTENLNISPREVTAELFERKLKRRDVPDIVVMHVEVSGLRNGNYAAYAYHVLDRYDKQHQVTAMARTTAYTASVTAQLLAKKTIREKGVIPPEKLGMNKEFYNDYVQMMKKREVTIKESRDTAK
jgi:saccharopine dehydrogenase-like NADP-dependent oxidoreductase